MDKESEIGKDGDRECEKDIYCRYRSIGRSKDRSIDR